MNTGASFEGSNGLEIEIGILSDMLNVSNPKTERLIIKENGEFDKTVDTDGRPLYFAASGIRAVTPEQFYDLAQRISEAHPEYHFEFNQDPEGKWFEYTVTKDL